MLNEVDPAVNRSVANGSVTSFVYSWKIDDEDDIEVLDNDDVRIIGVHYTVTGVGDSGGGTVEFLVAPVADHIITRKRGHTLEQQSDYIQNEGFPNARVEGDFDALVMIAQELKEVIGRALKFKKSSSLIDQAVDDPTEGLFARAKVGGGIDWASVVSAGSIAVPVSIAQGGTGAITAALALVNLGIPVTSGTWTLSLGGTATYTSRSGTWIRIGNMVFITGQMVVNVIGTGTASSIAGLPFIANRRCALSIAEFNTLAVSPVSIDPYVGISSTAVFLYGRTAAAASSSLLAMLGNGSDITFSGWYEAQ